MRVLALLVILLFGAGLFFLLAYLLRKRFPKATLGLWITGLVVSLFLLALWLIEMSGGQRNALYRQVQYGLSDTTLQQFLYQQEDFKEQGLLLASLASSGLRQMATIEPDDKALINQQVAWMAAYVADEEQFPAWNLRSDWEQQAFFLSHAAIVLANYQALTLDEQYGDHLTRICRFLAAGITRSRYKHLASRPGDSALRPQDNAAALYALYLYDQYYAEELSQAASEDWMHYIEKELRYEDTKLPCAGFTATNRCRLSSVGGSLAILATYSTAAELPIAKDFWREFRYYYKETFINVLANIQNVMNDAPIPEFCEDSVVPLDACDGYQHVFAQYAAANRQDWITYYQLNNSFLIDDLLNPPNEVWSMAPQHQIMGLIKLSARLCASTKHR